MGFEASRSVFAPTPNLFRTPHSSLRTAMKRNLFLSASLLLASAATFGFAVAPDFGRPNVHAQVFFSPKGGCTGAIVKQIGAATASVDVEAFEFTSKPIAHALMDAQKRGVAVRVVLDERASHQRGCVGQALKHAGIPVWLDARHAIFHDKVMVLDGATILTGSFNFSDGAENRNAENLLVLSGASELARPYEANFETHLAHSSPLPPPSATAADSTGGAG